MKIPEQVKAKFREVFGLDLRSLALFRIALSFFILGDLIVRSFFLRAQYTDFGSVPRVTLIQHFLSSYKISFHLMSGRVEVQAVLFVLAGIFALMLLVGYRTWLAAFFSWLFMLSLHHRNGLVLQGGDVLFHLLLFWGLFLPLGARYSVDRVLTSSKNSGTDQKYFCSAGTFGFFMQIAMVYFFAAANKFTPNACPIWWKEGSAVQYVLTVEQFATPFGHSLLRFPALLKFLNYLTLFIEGIGPFFLFSPFYNGVFRLFAIFLFILLQQGFNVCMALGPFPWVATTAMLAFLPVGFWNWLASNPKLAAWGQRLSTAVASGVQRISQNPWAHKFLKLYPANHPRLKASIFGQAFALLCVIYILFWNAGNFNKKYGVPYRFHWFGMSLGIDQAWNMFSPPIRDDGWYVIPGVLKNGREVDLFRNGAPVNWDKPKNVAAMYPNERWRKYMTNYRGSKNAQFRRDYGKYLCRDWNSRHQGEEQLDRFQVFFMEEMTRKDFTPAPVQKKLLWRHFCFKVPALSTRPKSDKIPGK
ncbi:MAG: HTTM domain-containing protein [Candidatus Omnitrophica bacterium]|nr:HTTM domain-containing protein [Candidatus Omnitrophota bacterium]